jgi:hypothetical protein
MSCRPGAGTCGSSPVPAGKLFAFRDRFTRSMSVNRAIPALCILLAAVLAVSGCTGIPGGSQAATTPDPIAGSWLFSPADDREVLELYIFKESGRFDATQFPKYPADTLGYELYATGTWTRTGDTGYALIGNAIYHYFSPDTHTNQKINVSLTYNPFADSLYITGEPGNQMVRVSRMPIIPPGLNVSFPFD